MLSRDTGQKAYLWKKSVGEIFMGGLLNSNYAFHVWQLIGYKH